MKTIKRLFSKVYNKLFRKKSRRIRWEQEFDDTMFEYDSQTRNIRCIKPLFQDNIRSE